MKDKVAVIGGGIGGVLSARLFTLLGYKVFLFEKSARLGGCAGSFKREGLTFNIGATTVGGLFPEYPVFQVFKLLDVPLKESCQLVIHNPTMILQQNGRKLYLTPYLYEWEEKLRAFLGVKKEPIKKLLSLTENVLKDCLKRPPYFSLHSFKSKLKSFFRGLPLIVKYYLLYNLPASKFLKELFGQVDKNIWDFFNGLTLITAQSTVDKINTLTLLLSLGYVATGVGSPKEGMSSLFDSLSQGIDIYLNSEVISLRRLSRENNYLVRTKNGEEIFQKVVLSLPILENLHLLKEDVELYNYFKSFESMKSAHSALVLYGVTKGPDFPPHLLIYSKDTLKGLTSGKYFISFFKQKENLYTFTLSTHTPLSMWKNKMKPLAYEEVKEHLKKVLLNCLLKEVNLNLQEIKAVDVATPLTFFKYLSRTSLGGIPITMENSISRVPPNITPFKGLYLLNDQSLFYQGWLGLSTGLMNLYEVLKDEKL
ncbi:MAG: FAD-dependent oxidoreductase [Thermodesulfobacterium sp.]|nr:FAD-dependent oxidoreductase [Thermodesulfobacterium sp.]